MICINFSRLKKNLLIYNARLFIDQLCFLAAFYSSVDNYRSDCYQYLI